MKHRPALTVLTLCLLVGSSAQVRVPATPPLPKGPPCAPRAYTDYRTLIGRQAVVFVPKTCTTAAYVRKVSTRTGQAEAPLRLNPGSTTRLWLFVRDLQYATDRNLSTWKKLEVRP